MVDGSVRKFVGTEEPQTVILMSCIIVAQSTPGDPITPVIPLLLNAKIILQDMYIVHPIKTNLC